MNQIGILMNQIEAKNSSSPPASHGLPGKAGEDFGLRAAK